MERIQTPVTPSKDRNLGDLRAILFLLQSKLEEFKDEVDRSYALLQVGEKTDFSKKLEKKLKNPLPELFQSSSDIDEQIRYILDKVVRSFLKTKASLIKAVYFNRTSLNNLHYSIVLNEDTSNNRYIFFEFLEQFDLIDLSNKYPVYFQFMPIELVDKIENSEIINL